MAHPSSRSAAWTSLAAAGPRAPAGACQAAAAAPAFRVARRVEAAAAFPAGDRGSPTTTTARGRGSTRVATRHPARTSPTAIVPAASSRAGGDRAEGAGRGAVAVRRYRPQPRWDAGREAAGEPRVMRRGAAVLAGAGDHPRRRRRRRRRSSSQAASSSSPRWTLHLRRRARGTAVAFPPARSRRRRAAPWHAPGPAADGRSPSPASPRAPAVPRLQPRRAARRPTSSSQPPASEHLHPRA